MANKQDFDNYKFPLAIACTAISGAEALVGWFLSGKEMEFPLGVLVGTVALLINLLLMEKAVDMMIRRERITIGIIILFCRILVYGITMYISYSIGKAGLIGFGASAISLPVAVCVIFLRKEGSDDTG
ncbi:MAG: hypothetical protein PUB87_08360 [Eubacteriaceae bacterium]|nr:hypothetical protein [Eubacteriaceae bacterium]